MRGTLSDFSAGDDEVMKVITCIQILMMPQCSNNVMYDISKFCINSEEDYATVSGLSKYLEKFLIDVVEVFLSLRLAEYGRRLQASVLIIFSLRDRNYFLLTK